MPLSQAQTKVRKISGVIRVSSTNSALEGIFRNEPSSALGICNLAYSFQAGPNIQ